MPLQDLGVLRGAMRGKELPTPHPSSTGPMLVPSEKGIGTKAVWTGWWISHSQRPLHLSLSWRAGPLSHQHRASTHRPPTQRVGKSSYSPLLDFLLGNCKKKQKSSLLAPGDVPGDEQMTPGSLLPALPTPPHILPALGRTSPALNKNTAPRWTVPGRSSVSGHPRRGQMPTPCLAGLLGGRQEQPIPHRACLSLGPGVGGPDCGVQAHI